MLEPTQGYIDELIRRIDEALRPLGAMYTMSIRK
jgi:hypothetical protein